MVETFLTLFTSRYEAFRKYFFSENNMSTPNPLVFVPLNNKSEYYLRHQSKITYSANNTVVLNRTNSFVQVNKCPEVQKLYFIKAF